MCCGKSNGRRFAGRRVAYVVWFRKGGFMRFADFLVPSVRLTPERRMEVEELLRTSNLVLKGHYPGDYPGGLRAFFAEVCRGGVSVPPEDLSLIRRVKEVEWELLCDCSRLIYRIASRWGGELDGLSSEDVEMVAVEAFLKAVCGYVGGCRFSTYLVRCVERHMMRMREGAENPLGFPLEVVRRRREVRRLMGREGATLDSAVLEAAVPGEMVGVLMRSMGALESRGDMEAVSRDCGVRIDDMEALGALEGLELDPLERAVLDELVRSGGELNLSLLARGLVNPRTGKPYTRMNMSLVWRRLKNKIRAGRKAA